MTSTKHTTSSISTPIGVAVRVAVVLPPAVARSKDVDGALPVPAVLDPILDRVHAHAAWWGAVRKKMYACDEHTRLRASGRSRCGSSRPS